MSFFEPRPPLPALPDPGPQPEWAGPPDNVLGAAVPLELVVARSAGAAVVVRNVVAYPTGLDLVLDVRRRKASAMDDPLGMHPMHLHALSDRETTLRFGVGFADGSKATTDGGRPWPEGDTRGPVLVQRGGGGGGRRWSMGYWLWPLPPDGPLAFVAQWEAEGIPETRVEVDAGMLREAAARAETLWEQSPGPAGGGFTTMRFSSARDEPPESD